jgi:glycosyltransferase involved in cell wall biosynthesis
VRVSVLTYRASYGAFATIARNIAKGLTEAGVDVDILYLAGPPADDVRGYPERVRLIRLGGRSRTCWPAVARHLRERRPNGLISLGWILNPAAVVAVALARTRTPLVLNEQSLLSYKTRVEHRHQLNLRILSGLARLLYPKATAITGASTPIIADLEHEIGLDPRRVPLHVIPNAVDAKEVQCLSLIPDDAAVREHAEPVFVNVARHARQKNLPLLLRAFRTYLGEGGSGTLVLVGAGPDTDELRTLASDLGLGTSVVFRGLLTNPFPQVAASTAFVMSSEEEGFGLVLVEAMALGVPVISTDCPGGPREILRDGAAGLLVPADDEQALAQAMQRIAVDPSLQRRLASAGTERAKDFTPSVVGRAWLDVLHDAGAVMDAPKGGSACRN